MDIWSQYVLPCLCAFAGCIGFTLVFNIHGPGKLIACCGGVLGWLVYLLAGKTILAGFFAAMAISLFSEVMARIRRCPVTGYQLVALLPLVPGGGIYYAMGYCLEGDTEQFLSALLGTLGMAAALAVTAIAVADVHSLIGMGRQALERMEVFADILLPTMAAVTAAQSPPVSFSGSGMR